MFDEFWARFPKKVGKGAAARIWSRMNAADRAAALDAVKEFAEVWGQCAPDRYAYLCYPTTWLNQRRWEDDRREWRRQAGIAAAPATDYSKVEIACSCDYSETCPFCRGAGWYSAAPDRM